MTFNGYGNDLELRILKTSQFFINKLKAIIDKLPANYFIYIVLSV